MKVRVREEVGGKESGQKSTKKIRCGVGKKVADVANGRYRKNLGVLFCGR